MTLPNTKLTDHEIRELLLAIDEHEDINVTTWEAEFLESILYQQGGLWSVAQRAKAYQIVEKYRTRL